VVRKCYGYSSFPSHEEANTGLKWVFIIACFTRNFPWIGYFYIFCRENNDSSARFSCGGLYSLAYVTGDLTDSLEAYIYIIAFYSSCYTTGNFYQCGVYSILWSGRSVVYLKIQLPSGKGVVW